MLNAISIILVMIIKCDNNGDANHHANYTPKGGEGNSGSVKVKHNYLV